MLTRNVITAITATAFEWMDEWMILNRERILVPQCEMLAFDFTLLCFLMQSVLLQYSVVVLENM